MFSLIAYYEAQDGAAALHNVAAIQDQHVKASGDYVYIPKAMPNIIGKACLSNADAALTLARLNSPSLRRIAYPEIEPIVAAVTFGSPPEGILHPECPIPVDPDEGLAFEINSDETADSSTEYGLVFLSDGPQAPVKGAIFPVRATAAITLSAGVWVNGNLTFSQSLPVGVYDIVGMRARGTNLVAARLVFNAYINRPGVVAVNAISDQDHFYTRYGHMGVFGRFDHTTPPTVDCLGVTDTSQIFIFDLMKIS
jgi:hypothetical protein